MQTVLIAEVVTDSVLARDLKDASGGLILAKGAKLSSSLIARLTRMNVKEVAVEGDSGEFVEKIQAKLQKLKHRFEDHSQNPFMMELEIIMREHFESKMPTVDEGAAL